MDGTRSDNNANPLPSAKPAGRIHALSTPSSKQDPDQDGCFEFETPTTPHPTDQDLCASFDFKTVIALHPTDDSDKNSIIAGPPNESDVEETTVAASSGHKVCDTNMDGARSENNTVILPSAQPPVKIHELSAADGIQQKPDKDVDNSYKFEMHSVHAMPSLQTTDDLEQSSPIASSSREIDAETTAAINKIHLSSMSRSKVDVTLVAPSGTQDFGNSSTLEVVEDEPFKEITCLKFPDVYFIRDKINGMCAVRKLITDNEEYLILSQLKNTGVVPKLYAWPTNSDKKYIFMEYINGLDIENFLKLIESEDFLKLIESEEFKRIPDLKQSLKKIVHNSICKSVDKIHDEGIAHLDLHEENIKIRLNDEDAIESILIDFGEGARKDEHDIDKWWEDKQSDDLDVCLLFLKSILGCKIERLNKLLNLNVDSFAALVESDKLSDEDKNIVTLLYDNFSKENNLALPMFDDENDQAFKLLFHLKPHFKQVF